MDFPETNDPNAEWASEDELEAERERQINNEWECWFRMIASNYPERERIERKKNG